MKEFKITIPEKKRKRIMINIEMSESKKNALRRKCKELGISYSFLLNSFIDQFLEAE